MSAKYCLHFPTLLITATGFVDRPRRPVADAHPEAVSTVGFVELIARQSGVVSIAQAVAAGVPPRTAQYWARNWRRLHPGVYLVAGHRLTPEGRIRAALLWAGPDAVLTGQAAANWHGLPAPVPAVLQTTLPVDRKPRSQPGIQVRRRELQRLDVTVVRGLRVAAAPFAALETAVALRDGSVFLDRVLQRHVRFPELYRCFCRNVGRHGSSEAGRLITGAADRADSAAERVLTQLLRQSGISGWRTAEPFGPYVIDIAFAEAKLAIEVDGWAWHVDADRFRNDRRKGNALVRAGWTLLRFTWHDLTTRPAECLAEILDALALAAA
jgi:very-short-patch-repair endonuclease